MKLISKWITDKLSEGQVINVAFFNTKENGEKVREVCKCKVIEVNMRKIRCTNLTKNQDVILDGFDFQIGLVKIYF